MADEVGRLVEEAVHTKTRRCRAMRRSRFDPARQRPDRSFEWQSGTRTGRAIFVSSCETYWRDGRVFGSDLVRLYRILEIKTDCRYLGGCVPVTETCSIPS